MMKQTRFNHHTGCCATRILSITLAAIISVCSFFSIGNDPNSPCAGVQRETIEEEGAFKLPASQSSLEFSCSDGGFGPDSNYYVHVRFEMSPTDLADFQASTLVETWQTEAGGMPDFGYPFEYAAEPTLVGLSSFIAGKGSQTLTPHWQQVVIDTSSPEHYVVYIEAGTVF